MSEQLACAYIADGVTPECVIAPLLQQQFLLSIHMTREELWLYVLQS